MKTPCTNDNPMHAQPLEDAPQVIPVDAGDELATLRAQVASLQHELKTVTLQLHLITNAVDPGARFYE